MLKILPLGVLPVCAEGRGPEAHLHGPVGSPGVCRLHPRGAAAGLSQQGACHRLRHPSLPQEAGVPVVMWACAIHT